MQKNLNFNVLGHDHFNRLILVKKLPNNYFFFIKFNGGRMCENEIDLYNFHKEEFLAQKFESELQQLKTSFVIEAEFEAEVLRFSEITSLIKKSEKNQYLTVLENEFKNVNKNETNGKIASIKFQSKGGDIVYNSLNFIDTNNSFLCRTYNSTGLIETSFFNIRIKIRNRFDFIR